MGDPRLIPRALLGFMAASTLIAVSSPVSAEPLSLEDPEDAWLPGADILGLEIVPQDGFVLVEVTMVDEAEISERLGLGVRFRLYSQQGSNQFGLSANFENGRATFTDTWGPVEGELDGRIVRFRAASHYEANPVSANDFVEEKGNDPPYAETYDPYEDRLGYCIYDRAPDPSRYGGYSRERCGEGNPDTESAAAGRDPEESNDSSDDADAYSCLLTPDNCEDLETSADNAAAKTPWLPIGVSAGLGLLLLVCLLVFMGARR